MRPIFVRSIVAIAVVLGLLATWIFGGRTLSMLIDRIHTVQINAQPVTSLSLEEGTGGTIAINGMLMNSDTPNNQPFPMTIGTDAQGRIALTIKGESIILGSKIESGDEQAGIVIRPDPGDEASFRIRRSFMSWPTPFDFNFMSGHSPTWKRHLYYRLFWRKADGTNLEMVWRYEQYFYPNDGWASGFMTREGSTGLARAAIRH
jgi:hypothetical protein